ncbi:hypothetical protein L3i22_029570 [Actinoplanes sp. L3-i22]|nr:hypothetical protein L3i22_029570 [Actinoplanes sp. L3-i22]
MNLNAALDRNRRLLLITMALVAATADVARLRGFDPDHLAVVLAVPVGLAIVLWLVIIFGDRRREPSFLVIEADHAFRTRPSGTLAVVGVGHLATLGLLLLYPPDFAHGSFQDRFLLPTVAAGFLLYWRTLWSGDGITLTPAGVHADKARGTVTFPWEALDQAKPPVVESNELEIAYRRPELVKATGLLVFREWLTIGSVPLPTIAAALRHYLAHPEDRAGIGTTAGHERLFRAIADEPPLPPPGDDDEDDDEEVKPWTRARLAKRLTVVALALVAFCAAGAWVENAAGDESASNFAFRIVGGAVAATIVGHGLRVIKEYRRDRKR